MILDCLVDYLKTKGIEIFKVNSNVIGVYKSPKNIVRYVMFNKQFYCNPATDITLDFDDPLLIQKIDKWLDI